MMLHTKHQGTGPFDFRQKKSFTDLKDTTGDPTGVANFGRGPLDNATHKIEFASVSIAIVVLFSSSNMYEILSTVMNIPYLQINSFSQADAAVFAYFACCCDRA